VTLQQPKIVKTIKGKEIAGLKLATTISLQKPTPKPTKPQPTPTPEATETADAILTRQMELQDARKQLAQRATQITINNTPAIPIKPTTDITKIHQTTRTITITPIETTQTQPTQPATITTPYKQSKATQQALKRRQYAQKLQGILKKTTPTQHKPSQLPTQQTTTHVPTQAPSLNIELATHYTEDEKKLWVYVSNI
jgi:hypothetical protein